LLRKFLAERYSRKNLRIDPDNILITTGSQQALDLTARLFINGDDRVIVENPTYLGMLLACNVYKPNYLTADSDEHGMVTDMLPILFTQKAKFIYVVPNFQNPQGTTLRLDRRLELVKLAKEHSMVILEDNPYGELRYRGEDLPSLLELAP